MKTERRSLYLYPITKSTFRNGGNDYMHKLVVALSQEFNIVNKQTSLGLFDVLFKLPKIDILYLNWIEDIAGRKFPFLHSMLLFFIIFLSKVFQVRIVWFVHNNISHFKDNLWLKKLIVAALSKYADVVLSHSREVTLDIPARKFYSFDHPVEGFKPVNPIINHAHDILIWGTVSPHKGVEELLKFNYSSPNLLNYRILIAGKFQSQSYFDSLQRYIKPNIRIDNRILTEAELEEYFRISKFVLFPYNSPSVLSSAALCKTLCYGKPIIGPSKGSFKELGEKGLIYNYKDFSCLHSILLKLKNQKDLVDEEKLKTYIQATSWTCFADFLIHTLNKDVQASLSLVTH